MKRGFLFVILGLLLCIGQAFAATVDIAASRDAHWYSASLGTGVTTNQGVLFTGFLAAAANMNATTLIAFPVSGISYGDITSVTLNLYQFSGNGTIGTTAFNAGDDWTESMYGIEPSDVSAATTSIGSSTVPGTARGWQTWALTLTPEMFDGTLSIALKETSLTTNFTNSHGFYSSEDSLGHNPYLRVTTASAVPVPPSVWLLGSGLIGLVGLRRRFRIFSK